MSTHGKLIVIEGLDGSGKATQSALLAEHLQKSDKPALKISFPDYESESSALVKLYLAGEVGSLGEVNVYAASSFYAADRYISYLRHWKQSYELGCTIIADRYTTSNAVHQMSRLPAGQWDDYLNWLADYEYARMRLPRPDLVLYLDMQPQTSRELLLTRYEGNEAKRDIHERDFAYLLQCRQAALYAAEQLGWVLIPCCNGHTPFAVEDIAADIAAKVNTIL